MAPSDVWLSIDGYNRRERAEWERTRMTWLYIHLHAPLKKHYQKPQELHRFPWEEKEGVHMVSSGDEVKIQYLKLQAERQGVSLETLIRNHDWFKDKPEESWRKFLK